MQKVGDAGLSGVLITSPKDDFIASISDLLHSFGIDSFDKASGGADALRRLSTGYYDIFVIGSGIKDMNPYSLALTACENRVFTIMICPRNHYELFASRGMPENLILLAKPVNRNLLASVFSLLFKLASPRKYINIDFKEINKQEKLPVAKQLLIEMLEMSEDTAHRFIQRNSMNLRIPIDQIVQMIIQTFGHN